MPVVAFTLRRTSRVRSLPSPARGPSRGRGTSRVGGMASRSTRRAFARDVRAGGPPRGRARAVLAAVLALVRVASCASPGTISRSARASGRPRVRFAVRERSQRHRRRVRSRRVVASARVVAEPDGRGLLAARRPTAGHLARGLARGPRLRRPPCRPRDDATVARLRRRRTTRRSRRRPRANAARRSRRARAPRLARLPRARVGEGRARVPALEARASSGSTSGSPSSTRWTRCSSWASTTRPTRRGTGSRGEGRTGWPERG